MAPGDYLHHGPRVTIRHVCGPDRAELTALARGSADLHRPWLGAGDHTEEAFARYLKRLEQPTHESFATCLRGTGAIVGSNDINNIVRGTLQSGSLGYTAYASTTGCGYMTEGLGLVVRHAFGALGLHRPEANIQPGNAPSLKLVERLGFRREGYSAAFQFINGKWRDHERWAITARAAGPHQPPVG